MAWRLYIDDRLESLDIERALEAVPPHRREKALRYRHESGRRQCLAAWMLLMRALRDEYGMSQVPDISFGPAGKPFFDNAPGIHFNLSHCEAAVACVVGDAPMGVDVETVRHVGEGVMRYVLNDRELAMVESSARRDAEFTRLWTVKESLLKLSGHGLLSSDEFKTLITPEAQYATFRNAAKGYFVTVAQ